MHFYENICKTCISKIVGQKVMCNLPFIEEEELNIATILFL
jgi:hypothetical protein